MVYIKDEVMTDIISIANQEAMIVSKIITLRNEKVILDLHLAGFYGVETRVLKQAVRRNRDRFPADFMYELTPDEVDDVVSQFVIPSKKYFGGARPFAFTENGIAMLSSILNSKSAIKINIAIMRTFTMIRKAMLLQIDIENEIIKIRQQLKKQDEKLLLIFDYLKQLEKDRQQKEVLDTRRKIGFRKEDGGYSAI
jgi:hypothetical protein